MTTGSQTNLSKIDFHTKREKQILSQMWSKNSKRELQAWRKTLSPKDRQISVSMEEMLLLSGWDEEVTTTADCGAAMEFLHALMAKG